MSRIQAVLPHIYHEPQEAGSMLCAQHALNTLVQSPHFTAPDLATIARSLDQLEDSHMDVGSASSANYDETGFFSVQVMEEACKSVGLRLIRWRSEEMASRHDHPEEQDAFILNHELHWYTLRCFGSSPHHFYNLDSTLPQPEWISPTLLGMTLYQAEREGYSIFTIMPNSKEEGLFPCEADQMARQVGDGDYINGYGYSSSQVDKKRRSSEREDGDLIHVADEVGGKRARWSEHANEDDELSLAIAASLLDDQPVNNIQSASGTHTKAIDHIDSDDDDDDDVFDLASEDVSNGFSTQPPPTNNDDDELAKAIAASLEPTSTTSGQDQSEWDEPSIDEMRRMRLARFG